MKRLIIWITLWTFAFFTLPLLAEQYQYTSTQKPLTSKKIQKMDQSLTHTRTVTREFKNLSEFQRLQRQRKLQERRNNALSYQAYDRFIPYYRGENRQKGYRYPKRGWELAYRYDRADFFDRYGYHYGYFNRHGYYFEGIFYRYDRFYRYHDRVRGKELFGKRFYMPANYRYYGFDPHPYR